MNEAERLTRLEERYVHLQRHVVEQDKVMLGLGEQLAKLRQEMINLRAQTAGGASTSPEDSADERPPHY